MKRYAKITALMLAVMFMSAACASAKFSDVQDKDWDLVEVQIKPENISFDRKQLEEQGFTDIFTLRFDKTDSRVNGIGAPNRFFAPYSLSGKQDISIKAVAATLMAPIREPEKLKEHDYFMYLQNTSKWNLVKGNLELYSTGEDSSEVVLVFLQSGTKR